MTDEQLREILQTHTLFENIGDNKFSFLSPEAILSAMREAVQKESIEFAEWIEINFYRYIHSSKKWFKVLDALTFPIDTPTFTTEQLYNEYIKSLNK